MTYVSAIYEYNLSVRPDYDRDIARKKASAIFYKFDIQHAKVLRSISFVRSRLRDDGISFIDPTFPQPDTVFAGSYARCEGDLICKNEKYHETTLFFEHNGYDIPIYLRPECDNCAFCDGKTNNCMLDTDGDGKGDLSPPSSEGHGDNGEWYQKIMLTNEQALYDETEMASKVLCLKNKLYENTNESCVSDKDDDGNLENTCCYEEDVYRVLVSYKRVDPRWLNRITNGIAMDFWRAIENRPFYTNLGIVQWDEGKDKWIFQGKTSHLASYYDKYVEWKAQEEQRKLEEGSSFVEKGIPRYISNVTTWELPDTVFDEDFFVDLNGNEMCKENGCIFRINEF
jgi:hypothetical protein